MNISQPITTRIFTILVACIVMLTCAPGATAQQPLATNVLIAELQTSSQNDDGTENAKGEFIELYNPADTPVAMDGWQLEFLTKTHNGVSTPTRIIAKLTGSIPARDYYILSYADYAPDANQYFTGGTASGQLPKNDGTVRLVDAQDSVIDIVGWGSPHNYATMPAATPPLGLSLQRCHTKNTIVDTQNNSTDFSAHAATPGSLGACNAEDPADPNNPEPTTADCQHIVISELLANPKGADAGQEFIEFHNPTETVLLLGDCTVTIGTKNFALTGSVLPHQYKILSNEEVGFVLPNASGGTVSLLADGAIVRTVAYPPGMAEGNAWALKADHTWHHTYTPTPGTQNIITPTKPCEAGEVRDTATGRCNKPKAEQSDNLVPCKPGQTRNPGTNRCRATAVVASTSAPCAPGQERNPATNRCRKIPIVAAPAPCPAGQERNLDTNRCRKVSSAAVASVTDIPTTPNNGATAGWWLLGIAAAGAVGYGVYEWRHDIIRYSRRIKEKIAPSSPT